MSNVPVIQYNTVKATDIEIDGLKKNERSQSQNISYIYYKGQQLHIQTPIIKLDNYGMPDPGGSFFQTARQCAHLKCPLDINENVENETDDEKNKRRSELSDFKKVMMEIDNYFDSDEVKEKLFDKKKDKFTYTRIVRKSRPPADDSDDSDEEEKEVQLKPDYMKINIELEYESENIKKTKVFKKNDKNSEEYKNGEKHTEIMVTSLADLKSNIKYMKNYRYVIHLSKLWQSKQPLAGQDQKNYGVTFKLIRVEIPHNTITKQVEVTNCSPFIDSDDDSDDDNESKEVKHFVEKADEEEDSDAESDETPPKPIKKKRGPKKSV